jgi:hypothetical protein
MPPYSAFPSFAEFVERAAGSDVPARVDRSLLADWQIAVGNESSLLTTLRALGFIDAEGRPTEAFRALRLSPPRRRAALRDSLRSAYPGLPGPDEPPPSDDDLHDYFVDRRGLAGQMAQKAMRFYRQLNAMARGTVTERVARSRPAARHPSIASPERARTPSGSPETSMAAEEGRAMEVTTSQLGAISASLTLQVQVPFEAGEAELEALFRRIRRAWEKAWSD